MIWIKLESIILPSSQAFIITQAKISAEKGIIRISKLAGNESVIWNNSPMSLNKTLLFRSLRQSWYDILDIYFAAFLPFITKLDCIMYFMIHPMKVAK